MDTKDLPFQKKDLKVIVRNPDNLHTIDYKKLKILQGDLKTLSKENKEKLYNSIKTYGYFLPAFVWASDGDMWILDATQRYHVLSEFEANGYEVPEIPYVTIEAKDKKEAAQKLLQITSRYGEINSETSFFQDFDIKLDYVNDIAIPELELAFEGLEEDPNEKEISEEDLEFEHKCPKCGYQW